MPIYHCQSAIAQQLSYVSCSLFHGVTMCKRWLQVASLPGSSPAGEDVTQAGEELESGNYTHRRKPNSPAAPYFMLCKVGR